MHVFFFMSDKNAFVWSPLALNYHLISKWGQPVCNLISVLIQMLFEDLRSLLESEHHHKYQRAQLTGYGLVLDDIEK